MSTSKKIFHAAGGPEEKDNGEINFLNKQGQAVRVSEGIDNPERNLAPKQRLRKNSNSRTSEYFP